MKTTYRYTVIYCENEQVYGLIDVRMLLKKLNKAAELAGGP
jgi:hypothetical protein